MCEQWVASAVAQLLLLDPNTTVYSADLGPEDAENYGVHTLPSGDERDRLRHLLQLYNPGERLAVCPVLSQRSNL